MQSVFEAGDEALRQEPPKILCSISGVCLPAMSLLLFLNIRISFTLLTPTVMKVVGLSET